METSKEETPPHKIERRQSERRKNIDRRACINNQRWSSGRPTEEGYYMINYGTCINYENFQPVKIFRDSHNVLMIRFWDGDTGELSKASDKFVFLNIGQLAKQLV